MGSVVGRRRVSSGFIPMGCTLSLVSSTGSRLLRPSRCTRATNGSFHAGVITRVCGCCRGQLLSTSTVSFSSVVIGAMGLLHRGSSVLRCCRGGFHCMYISRCRSAGRTRCILMDLLTNNGGGLYIINSSSRDVCHFHNTAVRGVLGFRSRCAGTGAVHLRRGCHSASGVLGTTGGIVTGGHNQGKGGL